MSTLAVVEEILRETAVPMSVREIVERAGVRLPSKSKTPDTVVARDLSMDIKKKGESSMFVRTTPGRYTLRALASNAVTQAAASATAIAPSSATSAASTPSTTSAIAPLGARKPAASAPSSTSVARPGTREAEGGGYAG